MCFGEKNVDHTMISQRLASGALRHEIAEKGILRPVCDTYKTESFALGRFYRV